MHLIVLSLWEENLYDLESLSILQPGKALKIVGAQVRNYENKTINLNTKKLKETSSPELRNLEEWFKKLDTSKISRQNILSTFKTFPLLNKEL